MLQNQTLNVRKHQGMQAGHHMQNVKETRQEEKVSSTESSQPYNGSNSRMMPWIALVKLGSQMKWL